MTIKIKPAFRVHQASQAVFEAMNTKNMAVLEPYLSENVKFDFPGTGEVTGKKRVLILLKALLRKYPDLQFKVRDMIVEQSKACIIWTNTAGLETSQPYRNRGVTLVNCDNGLITFISDYFKDTSFVNAANS